jgi:accessory gene regulator protein AgrB
MVLIFMGQLALHTELKCEHIDDEKELSTVICGFSLSHGHIFSILILFKLSLLKSQIKHGVILLMLPA